MWDPHGRTNISVGIMAHARIGTNSAPMITTHLAAIEPTEKELLAMATGGGATRQPDLRPMGVRKCKTGALARPTTGSDAAREWVLLHRRIIDPTTPGAPLRALGMISIRGASGVAPYLRLLQLVRLKSVASYPPHLRRRAVGVRGGVRRLGVTRGEEAAGGRGTSINKSMMGAVTKGEMSPERLGDRLAGGWPLVGVRWQALEGSMGRVAVAGGRRWVPA